MSNSTINFTNICHRYCQGTNFCRTYNNNTAILIVGDIQVDTPVPDAIDIKPIGPQVSSHIIFQKNDDTLFKSYFRTSPVRNFDVNIYDHHGHVSCRYGADRKDNIAGSVKITENKDILSNIDFPNIESGQLYLVITHYDGFEQLIIPESKRELVSRDIELLKLKVNTKKIVLFISDEINKEIEKLGIRLDDTFQSVISASYTKLIKYLVEYLVGKNISGSKPSFQGMLKFEFQHDVNVVMARFVQYDCSTPSVTSTIRRNGRIQINTDSQTARSHFIIVLTYPSRYWDPDAVKFSEETTKTVFEPGYWDGENIPGFEHLLLDDFIDSILFLEQLASKKDNESMNKFLSDNSKIAGNYIFASPLCALNNIETQSNLSNMIIDYGCFLKTQIFNILYANASTIQTNSRKIKPNKKKVFFAESILNDDLSEVSQPFTHSISSVDTTLPIVYPNYQ
jgi:hypothetical protein